ncbi:DEAD/DEAH box helicase [Rhodanobacter sp. B2A1Ga4]|uniref:DEAD/DEAH box helicase n=1 Tax=Rhodanobacter sp. B2A1Ga4 TaxID=2778647 RepID=UPI001B381E07|nr:DEAD/DEAH box helicase [Rhodanobacter sp. B2A1Ga4]MBQ4855709.1 DEAD/DEAH box helicase [Rhodanobacter sp. B2A1Ga4]
MYASYPLRATKLTLRESEGEDGVVVLTGQVGHQGYGADITVAARIFGSVLDPIVEFECPCKDLPCHHALALWEAALRELSAGSSPATFVATCAGLIEDVRHVRTERRPPEPNATFGLVLKTDKAAPSTNFSVPVSVAFYEPMPPGYRPTKLGEFMDLTPDALTPEDAAKVALLRQDYTRGRLSLGNHGLIDSHAKEGVFEELLATQRVYMRQFGSNPLIYGEPITPTPRWRPDDDGGQSLVLVDPDGQEVTEVLRLKGLWEFNRRTRVMRRLLGDERLITRLNQADVSILPTQVHATRSYMTRQGVADVLPLPSDAPAIRDIKGPVTPILRARLVRQTEGEPFPVATLTFDYGGVEVPPSAFAEGVATIRTPSRVDRIHKDDDAHAITFDRIVSAGFQFTYSRQLGGTGLAGEDSACVNGGGAAIDDLQHFWQSLDMCEAAGMQVIRVDAFPVQDLATTQSYHAISVSSDDAFDLDVGLEVEGERYSLADVMAATLADRRFPMTPRKDEPPGARWTLRLPTGSLVRIPLVDLRAILAPIAEWLGGEGRRPDGKVRMPRIQAALLANRVSADAPRVLKEMRAALRHLAAIEAEPLPVTSPKFVGELRHYQREGLRWLNALADAGLGGILGDDMGLGKTMQVIAHVLHLKDTGRLDEPVLVIVPTSVTGTWAAACETFAPTLKVEVLHGTGRSLVHERARSADILITTYGTAIKDIERLESQHFALVVADESQNARNPRTLTVRTLRRLRAHRHLNLTGTPLENRLLDLWSQMDLAVPGLLGSEKGFQRGIAGPIEKEDSDIHRVALNRRKAPFLLRRTKEEVATELPPKTITTTVVELEPAQRALYETIRAAQHEAVKAAIGERGLSQCGIVVLDALLKLRQVCCDPSLAPMASAKQVKGSAKLDALMELLHEAADGGRKVLVFSSFTQMLDRIAKRLEAEGIAFCVLTGETRKRDAVVAQFQTTDTPVFLLSLKAGGVGLNLTAADTVIHYDPWWNPAAEDQATDRAHRIGQIRPVNVYRLIAKNTIEERIEILKARKAALAQAILSGEGDASRGWTAADIDHLFAA